MSDLILHCTCEILETEPCCRCSVSGTINNAEEFHQYLKRLAKEGARFRTANLIVDETRLEKRLGLDEILHALSCPYSEPETHNDRTVAVIINQQNELLDNHLDHIFRWSEVNGRAFRRPEDAEAWMAERLAAKKAERK